MTAGERLLALAGSTGTAAALLLLIGAGSTTGEALTDYSQLGTNTAETHLLAEVYKPVQVITGSGKSKKRWIERDGKILIFESEDKAQAFIRNERKETQLIKESVKEVKQVETVKPVEIINKEEIKRLSKVYNYQQKLYHADQIGDISRIIAIYKEMQEREEDDIEILLMHI